MSRYVLIAFLFLISSKLRAQDHSLSYGKYLLDSIKQLPAIDTSGYSIDEISKVSENFKIVHATVYYDCNGDECFESRKGLITSKQDTLPPIFEDIIPLKNGELVLIGLQKLIQINSGLNVTKIYDHLGSFVKELAVFTKNDLYGLMNVSGEILLPLEYTYIENNEDNHVILAQKDGEWEAFDRNVLLKKEKEDEFSDWELVNTLLKVQHPKTYLWSVFSREAKQLTPFKYEDIKFTNYGDATASIDGYWGMINEKGKEVTEIKYDEIRRGYGVTYIGVQGLLSEKYGLVSIEGELTPIKYSQITTSALQSDVLNGYYWVAKEVKGNWGLLKLRGEPLTAFIYDEINFDDQDRPKGLMGDKWIELIK